MTPDLWWLIKGTLLHLALAYIVLRVVKAEDAGERLAWAVNIFWLVTLMLNLMRDAPQ